nr:PadR family transcriptional regulator [Anaerolineae bacterium]
MSLVHAILAVLDHTPMSGYQLKREAFDNTIGHIWSADQAQIYRTLDRLLRDGMIDFEAEKQEGRLDKKTYHITQKGKDSLDEWMTSTDPLDPIRDSFLVRLYHAFSLPNHQVLSMIEAEMRQYTERLHTLEVPPPIEDEKVRTLKSKKEVLRALTLELPVRLTRTYLDWLAHCFDVINQSPDFDEPQAGARERQVNPQNRRA